MSKEKLSKYDMAIYKGTIIHNDIIYILDHDIIPGTGDLVLSSNGWIGEYDENCAIKSDIINFIFLIPHKSINNET